MYEERRNNFSIRDIVLQLLLVVLFIFIMIWLFPTKDYLKNNFATKDDVSAISTQLQALYGRLYADNVESMRDAAKDYFTTSRLPKNVGDSVTLTLDEMLDKKLVLPFVDSNNQACDTTKSYVTLTKMDDEYQMKVQLTCSDYSDYIIVYMGCYDYCEGTICENKNTTTNTNNNNTNTNTEPKPTPTVNKDYEYEYRLVTQNSYSNWGNWSDWSTTQRSTDNLTQTEVKTDSVLKGYEQVYGIVGYDTETYTDYDYETTYTTTTSQVQVGTIEKVIGSMIYDTKPAKSGSSTVYANPITSTTSSGWSDWTYQGYKSLSYAITTSTYITSDGKTKYIYQSTNYGSNDCSGCTYNFTYLYKIYTRTYTSGTTTYKCPEGYNKAGSGSSMTCSKTTNTGGLSCDAYGDKYKLENGQCVYRIDVTKTVPVYKDVSTSVPTQTTNKVTKTRKVPIYGYKNGDPIYEKTTYYRYRTRTQTSVANTYYKWSSTQSDSSLTNQGYVLTGNSREV